MVDNGKVATEENPRTSNTGVEFTDGAKPALIDWLSFTVPSNSDGVATIAADLAISLAGGADVPALERGAMGYTHGYRLPGSGVVLFNPDRIDMGVHCSLSSGALALIPHDPKELIAKVLGVGGKFTRLDVALDTDKVHISTVNEAIARGDLVSRSIERTYQGSYKGDGYTIYIGARSSDRFVRIYNKAAQMKMEAGKVLTRAEVEFKKTQAQIAACYIFEGVDLRSLIFSAIDFRDRAVDKKNVSRCPQLDWWAAWVGVVDRVSFAVETVAKTVSRVYGWIVKQCAPSLAFLDEVFGGGSDWLFQLCDENKDRVPAARLNEVSSMSAAVRSALADMLTGSQEPGRSSKTQLPEPGAMRLHLGSLADPKFGMIEMVAA